MDALTLTRRQAYRLAERTFRYPVYITLEISWALAAVLILVSAFGIAPSGWVPALLVGILSIAHSTTMTLHFPWLLLKSVILGGIVFGIAYGLDQLFALPRNPLSVSAVAASAYYLWLGEHWTLDRARQVLRAK